MNVSTVTPRTMRALVWQNLRIVLVAFLLQSSTAPWSLAQEQNNIVAKRTLYNDLGSTMGFIEGQNFSLNRISQDFPDLSAPVQLAKLKFDTTFSLAENLIVEDLKAVLKENYPSYIAKLQSQITKTLGTQVISREIATSFISQVEERANGKIPSPILETLLTYQYRNRPSEEFETKFIRSYNTKEHPKAHGLELSIRYPASWDHAEGERPHIIQKFTSENGRGLESFMIMVRTLPLPEDNVFSDQELNETFSETGLKEMLPADSIFLSSQPVILDNYKAGVINFEQEVQRLDLKMTMRAQMYVSVVKNKMIFLYFMVGAPKATQPSSQTRFSKFEPLFRLVANSFTIHNQYTE